MEEEKKFKINPHLKSGIPEVDNYLKEIHEYIESFDTSSIKRMLVSIDNISLCIVEDLDRIAQGDKGEYEAMEETGEFNEAGEPIVNMVTKGVPFKILNDDSKSKVFDRVMVLISKIKDFKEVSNTAESLRPEIEALKKIATKPLPKIAVNSNPLEEIQKARLDKNKIKK